MESEEHKRISEELGHIAKQIASQLGPRMFADQPGATAINLNIGIKMMRSGECIIDIGATAMGKRRPDCDDLKKDEPCAEHQCDDKKAAKKEDKLSSKSEAPKSSTPLNDALNKLFDDVQARNKKPE